MARRSVSLAHQFLVVLAETNPLIWRRILVPAGGTFWDLHVAIQDAMGWQDCHLHEFRVSDPGDGSAMRVGIPMDMNPVGERPLVAGWKLGVDAIVEDAGATMNYVYDFGDEWQHVVTLERSWTRERGKKYPRCIGGARACPPEDCGGAQGYEDLLAALANRRHPEHKTMKEWVGGDFDAEAFDAGAVEFDDPQRRWKTAFGGRS